VLPLERGSVAPAAAGEAGNVKASGHHTNSDGTDNDAGLGRKVYLGAVGAGAGLLARKALRAAWSKAARRDPPEEPADPQVAWREAAAWSAVSAVVVSLARLAATRRASAVWRSVAGPPAEPPES
jgi:hypothetical protein